MIVVTSQRARASIVVCEAAHHAKQTMQVVRRTTTKDGKALAVDIGTALSQQDWY